MRYEAKHNFFKKLASNLGNFVDIAWTLASRHQQWKCYHWMNTSTIECDEPSIGPGIHMYIIIHHLCAYFLAIFPGDSVAEQDRPVNLQSSEHCYRLYICVCVRY